MWYPTEYSILYEKQSSEIYQAKHMHDFKTSKRFKKNGGLLSLRWFYVNVFSIFSKKSSVVQKFPFFCFFASLCICMVYSIMFTTAHHTGFPTGVLIYNMCGQMCIWWTFYKTYFATPIPLPPDLHLNFSHTIKSYCDVGKSDNTTLPSVCYRCRIQQSSRIGHCGHANRCLVNYDHFCFFLWSPIHSTNYIYFYSYLVSMFTTMPCLLYTLVLHVHHCVRIEKEKNIEMTDALSVSVTFVEDGHDNDNDRQLSPSLEVRGTVVFVLWMILMCFLCPRCLCTTRSPLVED
jgi:hypothetical protein